MNQPEERLKLKWLKDKKEKQANKINGQRETMKPLGEFIIRYSGLLC